MGLFGPIKVRLAGLVLIAAVPLLLLSGTIAWQNYQLALQNADMMAMRIREAAVARHVLAISGAEQMMQAIAQMASLLGPGQHECHERLESVLLLQRARYANLTMFEPSGRERCVAGQIARSIDGAGGLPAVPDNPDADLLEHAAKTRGFTFGAIRPNAVAGDGWVIPIAYPITDDGATSGFLAAELRIGWFAKGADPFRSGFKSGPFKSGPSKSGPIMAGQHHDGEPGMPSGGRQRQARQSVTVPDLDAVWLSDPSGRLTPVAIADAAALPRGAALHALLHEPVVLDAMSEGGVPYSYASARLDNGYQLLVGYPAAADWAAARHILAKRLVQLALLLLFGLAAVAVGVHLAVIEPLNQLGAAVRRWRSDGVFDPAGISDPPNEVREVAASFVEVTKALAEHDARHLLALEKQNLLMKEIHHRVKNNLQIVASLLNLQASRIRLPEARAEFASARDRVRALATLHRHLYSEGEIHSINMRSFLTELCGQLFDAMGEKPGDRIALSIEASELEMSTDQAVPLSLIVTEAVSNALKYAFPDGRPGRVDVRLTSNATQAELVIRDDGVGIPAGRAQTDMGMRDGLGITLIRGFARQLGGTLDVEENGGTLYRLTLTLKRLLEDDAAEDSTEIGVPA